MTDTRQESKVPTKCVHALSEPILCGNPNCDVVFRPTRKWSEFCTVNCKNETNRLDRINGRNRRLSKGMHFARVERSVRLQRLLNVLLDYRPHTTKELHRLTGGEAIGSTVGELRRNGYDIPCTFRERTKKGSMVYEYQLRRD